MNRPHFRRHPRPTDPAPDWWGPACTCTTHAALRARDALHATLRAEGTRYDAEWPDVLAAEAPGGDLAAMAAPWPGMARDDLGTYAEPVVAEPRAIVTRSRQKRGYFWLPCPVCGEHFSGADSMGRFDRRPTSVPDPAYPAGSGRGKMICPRCIMAGRGVNLLDAEACTAYFAQRAGRRAEPVVLIKADLTEFRAQMAHVARTVAELTEPVKPRGRHRQTDPLDLILADLRDLGGAV